MSKSILFMAMVLALGCGKENKVSNEDAQLKALRAQMVAARALGQAQALQIDGLVADITALNSTLTAIQLSLASVIVDVNDLPGQLATLQAQIDDLVATVNGLSVAQVGAQTDINSLSISIATLQGYHNIVSLVDPCGDAAGKVDEVLLRLSDGSLLASFSDSAAGLNTRFAVIGNGSYSTTDGTGCSFTVNNGVVAW